MAVDQLRARLFAHDGDIRVAGLAGQEAISRPYHFDVHLLADADEGFARRVLLTPMSLVLGPKSPYKIVGAPMVPHNQEVGLMLLSEQSFSYLARADGAPRGEWQPFCHHGAGYGLSIGSKVTGAQLLAAKTDAVSFWRKVPHLEPVDGNVVPTLVGMASWALFYWRLRYAVKLVEKKTAMVRRRRSPWWSGSPSRTNKPP